MPEFMHVDGFIVYQNIIVEDHDGRPDLSRDILGEYMTEDLAKQRVADELAADPTATPNYIYYEPGQICV